MVEKRRINEIIDNLLELLPIFNSNIKKLYGVMENKGIEIKELKKEGSL